ncbi:MAG TPA: Gfo/Idh/MocA family oxidoreductase [Solirubrobacteraceae bacterium]|jgi:predicted dehydrogenase|nr:Gfo/Idh/MocA family oxidoreductase [Solirubrobacteraceae bacterium]
MTYQRDFDRRVRLGLVGAGSHAYRNLLPALNYLPAELVAVCDIDGDLAARTAAQYGAHAHYTDAAAMYDAEALDAVLLCVSHALHPQLAVEAFGRGLHVWMEKPPATRAHQVAEMIAARGDRVAVVGLKKAFQPATRKAIEIVSQPGVTPLRSMLAVYPMSVPADVERALSEPDAVGRWLSDGCHPVSLMLAVAGPARAVTVVRGPGGRGGACLIEFESGVIGNLHLGEGTPFSQPFEYYGLFGEDWRVDIENSLLVRYQRGIPFGYGTALSFAPEGFDHGALVWEAQNGLNTLENKALFTQGIYGELMHFLECVLDDRPATIGTLEDALAVMGIYEAALHSDGDRVEVSGFVTA